MGSGASTPVYSYRIEPSRTYRGRQVAPPLRPMYRTEGMNETLAVANQDRYLLQRSPGKYVQNPGSQMVSRRGSPTPSNMYQDYAFVKERDVPRSGYIVQGGGEYIIKSNYAEKQKPVEYIIQDMSEYVLQSNGFYKLKDTGKYLIPSSAMARDDDVNDHPFAPSSSDTSTSTVSSDNLTQLRNSKKNLDRFYSSSSDGSSHSAPKVYRKGNTGLVLTQVKKALEATPPTFLAVPESEETSRSASPTPSVRSSVGTNTMKVPPNTGDGERDDEMLWRRKSNSQIEGNSKSTPRQPLLHHHSSPELYRTKKGENYSAGGSRDDSYTTTKRGSQHSTRFLSPTGGRKLRFAGAGSVTRVNSSNILDKSYLSPRKDEHDGTWRTSKINLSPEKPPHLTPSPQLSPRRRLRQKSAISTLSISPSTKSSTRSISRSPHQTPMKINTHGLVYI